MKRLAGRLWQAMVTGAGRFHLVLVVLAIVALTAGSIILTFQQQYAKEAARLDAIAELKTRQIADWLRERQSHARYLQTSTFLTEPYLRWRETGDTASRDRLQARLEEFREIHGLRSILLLDERGELLWDSAGGAPLIDPGLGAAARQAGVDGEVRYFGPYRDAAGQRRLDFLAPLRSPEGRPSPVAVLAVDPADYLYPILQNWPVPSASGEILLFRRDGDQVLFLNDLRHRSGSALELRLPMTRGGLGAARILRGEARLGQMIPAIDYRGVPVLGVARTVPGTDWILAVKVDRSEVYAEAAGTVIGIGLAGLLALIGAVAGAVLWRQRQQLAAGQRERTLQAQKLQTLQLLEAIANGSADAIFAKDAEGRYLLFNRAAATMIGKPAEAVLGQDDTALFPPQQAETMMAQDRQVLTGSAMVNREEELSLPTGARTFLTTKGLLRDADGTVFGLFGISRDITQRKQAEDELLLARNAAEAANRAKSEFLAHMSHEIRTPLNAVLGLTQVLTHEPLTANQRDMVERIQAAGQSLLAIINDILDLSKIEAGQLRLDPRSFDLETLLAKLNSLMGQAAQAKGLALRLAPLFPPPGWLVGDALRLEQVLLNLIGNAIKFTERGEVAVLVQSREMGETAMRLRFEVRDTGIGIAPETLGRLFTPFTQAETGITRRFGGTGLGLSICKRLVELMGGEIGVNSQMGQGSVFWFELPFPRAAEGETGSLAAPAVSAFPPGPRLAGLHLLAADDSPINRDVVERLLGLEGARVTLAADGQQAVQLLKAQPEAFAAVLMDVQMPVLDGLSATRLIRRELGLTELPIIALTAGVLEEERRAAHDAGVNDFVAKPVDLAQMVAALLRWTHPAGTAAESALPAPAARSIPEIPGFEPHQIALTFGDDREFFLELLGMFCAMFGDTAQEVQTDLAAGDRDAAARRLHALKGAAGNLGALALMRSAQGLEQAIIASRPDAERRLKQFAVQLADLIQAAAPWLQ